jgi:hypothetical protein
MSRRTKINRAKRQRKQRDIAANRVPSSLRIIEAAGEPLVLQAAEGEAKLRRFSMLAYGGGKLALANFYHPVVVDLSGLRVSAKARPILRDHDTSRIVGHTDEITVNAGSIKVAGTVSAANDHAREVVESSANGFPWQASIGASVQKMSFVDKGETVEVNGRKFAGPLYVARQATLGEVSFVALGADDNTSATVAAGKDSLQEQEMNFDAWLKAKGFDPATISDVQRASLQAMFDAEQDEADETVTATATVAAKAGDDGASADGVIQANRKAIAADMTRIAAIQKHAANHPEIAAKAISEGWGEDKVQLEVLKASRPQAPAGHVHTKEVKGEVIEAALCMAAKLPTLEKQFKPEVLEAAHCDYRHITLQELLITAACANGYVCGPGRSVNNGNLRDVLTYAFMPVRAGFSTLSLPGILSNVANKSSLSGYTEADQTWREISQVKSVNDFKQATSYRLLDSLEYEKLSPTGEIKHGSFGEESYTRQAFTYAKMAAMTRTDIINDDLQVLDDLRTRIGRGAAKKFNNIFWAAFMSNLATTFTAARTNYISGGTTNLGTDGVGLGLAVKAFRMMTSPSADGAKRIGGRPDRLIVPPELETIADQLYTALNAGAGTTVANTNTHANKYRPVVVPWLSDSAFTGNSATAFYLFRDPREMAVMNVSFLNGVETPTVESADADFNVLGIQFRGYHDFGCDVAEYLAGVMSKGAA